MTRRELIDYCLTYSDAYEDYPFDELSGAPDSWAVMRHSGNKKSFAFIYERGGLCVNLKCEPLRADFLRQVYPGVTPAYHMNKEHWNTVRPNEVPEDALYEMIDHSYKLTMPRGNGSEDSVGKMKHRALRLDFDSSAVGDGRFNRPT